MTSTKPNTTRQNAIEFRDVSLSFDGRPALIDVSFQLGRGEMIFLTGKSGSGKSVLLQSCSRDQGHRAGSGLQS
jgi:ABC-type ATPase involved in cell division